MRHPAPPTHEAFGDSPVTYVAEQGVASLQPRDLVKHLQPDADRPQAGFSGGKRVCQSQEVGKSPGVVVVEQQPVAAAPLVHPAAKPKNLRAYQDFGPGPQKDMAKPPIDHFDYAVAATADDFCVAGQIGDHLENGHGFPNFFVLTGCRNFVTFRAAEADNPIQRSGA